MSCRGFPAAKAALALALVLLAVASPGQAAELAYSSFRGVLIPGGAMAGDADGTAVETNPGQLGLLDGASLALVIDEWSDRTPRAGRGEALLMGAPLFGGLTLGLGVQSLRSTLGFEESHYVKFQLGSGLRLSRAIGLGFVWDHLFGHDGELNAFTVGLGLRFHPMVALGLAARDLTIPSDHRGGTHEFEGELALRPLGSDRLEAAVALRFEQGSRAPSGVRPRVRLSTRVAAGLTLFGEVDGARDDRFRLYGEYDDYTRVTWSALFGATLAFGRLGVTGAGVANWGHDESQGNLAPGASFVLRTFPGRRAPLLAPRHVERVILTGLENDGHFVETVVRLRRLADDPFVGAVLLEIDGLDLGLARIEELRGLVAGMRQRKPVFAQVTAPSMRDYYLAAACDRIVIHPAGAVTVGGLSQTVTFYKNALDKLGVKVELVRIAEYKGAMEPFILTEQSEPVRKNRNATLDDNYSRIIGAIAEGRGPRGLAVESLPTIIDQAVFSPGDAVKAGLVDAVADEKDAEGFVRASLGHNWAVREGAGGRFQQRVWTPSRIGVVLVDGAIVEGPEGGLPFSTGGFAYADRIIEAIDELRQDSSISAVVLRVNSPGGSALASDRIARAVFRLRARKPVIVSMGDLAASGGYYVAAPGHEIFASPGTTTGSIGIFSVKLDLEALLAKVGLSGETYKRGAHADMSSPFRAWTDQERKMVETHIRSMYQLFLDMVAAGRKSRGITSERADELGRGRIWTGAQALEVRLVDKLGGFSDALDEAARRGGVQLGAGGVPEVVILPRPVSSPLEALMRLQGLQAKAPASPLDGYLRTAARLLGPLLVGAKDGIEARLPYDISWR
jgi:protease-4